MAGLIGIDLGSRAIKVVSGRMKGPVFEVQRAFVIPVEPGDDPEAAILGAAGAISAELPKSAGARISLSGKELIIRYTQVPPVPTWRLRVLMDFEVREMSQQAGEPLASDYNLVSMPGKDDGSETVLVAVVKQHFLEARFQAVGEACGEVRAGTPASLALFNAYLHSGALHEGEYVFLVDIGDRNTEIALQRDGELLFARNLAAGGAMLTDAVAQSFGLGKEQAERLKEDMGNVTPKGMAAYASGKEEKVANAIIGPTGQLASMIQSSLAFARVQTGVRDLKVGRILLSGGGANLRGLPEYLGASFQCPVERFEPENGLDLSTLPAEETAEFERDPGRFAVALGLAVSSAKPEAFLVDLVPEKIRKKRALLQRSLFLWLSAAAALVVLVLRFLDLSSSSSDLASRERVERIAYEKAKKNAQEFQRQQDRLRDANEKQRLLAERSKLNFALATAPRLVQEHSPGSVWTEQLDAESRVDAAERKAGGVPRSIVTVKGETVSTESQPEAALQAMQDALRKAQPNWRMQIKKQAGGAAAGAKKLSFAVEMDPWPPEEPKAAEEEPRS